MTPDRIKEASLRHFARNGYEGALILQMMLFHFLLHYIERYDKSDSTKFMFRTAFFPPIHLNDQVRNYSYE